MSNRKIIYTVLFPDAASGGTDVTNWTVADFERFVTDCKASGIPLDTHVKRSSPGQFKGLGNISAEVEKLVEDEPGQPWIPSNCRDEHDGPYYVINLRTRAFDGGYASRDEALRFWEGSTTQDKQDRRIVMMVNESRWIPSPGHQPGIRHPEVHEGDLWRDKDGDHWQARLWPDGVSGKCLFLFKKDAPNVVPYVAPGAPFSNHNFSDFFSERKPALVSRREQPSPKPWFFVINPDTYCVMGGPYETRERAEQLLCFNRVLVMTTEG